MRVRKYPPFGQRIKTQSLRYPMLLPALKRSYSAWTFDPATAQYYYHTHLTAQPDLNRRKPDVVPAMMDVLRFWFERGVDGFRGDAVDQLIEDADFRDNPPNPDWHERLSPSN